MGPVLGDALRPLRPGVGGGWAASAEGRRALAFHTAKPETAFGKQEGVPPMGVRASSASPQRMMTVLEASRSPDLGEVHMGWLALLFLQTKLSLLQLSDVHLLESPRPSACHPHGMSFLFIVNLH